MAARTKPDDFEVFKTVRGLSAAQTRLVLDTLWEGASKLGRDEWDIFLMDKIHTSGLEKQHAHPSSAAHRVRQAHPAQRASGGRIREWDGLAYQLDPKRRRLQGLGKANAPYMVQSLYQKHNKR